ncbi:MAG: UxaA family hydrolase [Firmicutes bacterium]|nr:UxaA family hydrolase [Bacillota bacterium]
MASSARVIQLHPDDNVVTALEDLAPGTAFVSGGRTLATKEPVPFGYKVAVAFIPAGGQVLKYGLPIGVATEPIEAGAVVHTHNLKSLAELAYLGTEQGGRQS